MKEPIVALQVPHRNKKDNEDSDNESDIQEKGSVTLIIAMVWKLGMVQE